MTACLLTSWNNQFLTILHSSLKSENSLNVVKELPVDKLLLETGEYMHLYVTACV